MEGLKRNIVIMDFSGIYQEEQFYEGEQISWIDLSDISGTNCYCDGDAQAQILERMEKYPVSGIYFIDSGNYHYMSKHHGYGLLHIAAEHEGEIRNASYNSVEEFVEDVEIGRAHV